MYQLRLCPVFPIPDRGFGDADLLGNFDLQQAEVKAPLPDVLIQGKKQFDSDNGVKEDGRLDISFGQFADDQPKSNVEHKRLDKGTIDWKNTTTKL